MAERLASTLRRLAGFLSQWGHRAALIGGMAVVVRARPRFTDDVDAIIDVPEGTLENVDRAYLGAQADVLGIGERLAAFLSRAR